MKDLIDKAQSIPSQFWWEIEELIEQAPTKEMKEKLYWIMRKKELTEQIKAR
ncbi:hypothetical protein [Phocaeicola sp.]